MIGALCLRVEKRELESSSPRPSGGIAFPATAQFWFFNLFTARFDRAMLKAR
jgi:hypothetical protein